MYVEHVKKNFDLEAIRKSGLKLGYDAMYGAGQNVISAMVLPAERRLLHCDHNPVFQGQAPEPIHKNLLEFSCADQEGRAGLRLGHRRRRGPHRPLQRARGIR
jgi:phosphomannomutase